MTTMNQPSSQSPADTVPAAGEIVTIRPTATTMTRQHLPNFVGISAATAGATSISMNMVIIPPGAPPNRISTAAMRPQSIW